LPILHPKKVCLFGDPGCTFGTGGWALLRTFFKFVFALHWQSPDEGQVNVQVFSSFLYIFQTDTLSTS
jgi:hypothetical protein